MFTNVVFGMTVEVYYSLFSKGIISAKWLIFVEGFSHIKIFRNFWTGVLKGKWSRLQIFYMFCSFFCSLLKQTTGAAVSRKTAGVEPETMEKESAALIL